MAKAKKSSSSKPRSFGGLIRARTKPVQATAKALDAIIQEELGETISISFYGGQRPMAMYRTTADICWLQPLKDRCNVYFLQGNDLTDPNGHLEGKSKNHKFVKVKSVDHAEELPIREWLQESLELAAAAVAGGLSVDEVLGKLRKICAKLPDTKETLTWGKPHFRVGEKIFCGCGEQQGRARIGLKMEPYESKVMMQAPGIEKAPYSRPNDGWVSIDPNEFDDWTEIEGFVVGSFKLIAPKRVSAKLS